MALRLLAVADDLTGAHDCAARFAERLGPVPTAREAAALRGLGPGQGFEALVLDAETRFLEPAQARWKTARAWAALNQGASAALRFQKLDSTLRGNPAEDVEGLLLATAAPWVAVVAAYPAVGRQTLRGQHRVHGVPLQHTEYARDPLSPARATGPAGLFPPALSLHVPLAWVLTGRGRLAVRLRRALKERAPRFVSFDCLTTAQVDVIAQACVAAGCRHFAGSAALAASLAGLDGRLWRPRPHPPRGLAWVALWGSVSEQSFRQLRQARGEGRLAWYTLAQAPTAASLKRALRRGSLALSTLAGRQELRPSPSRAAAQAAGEKALRQLARAGRSLAGSMEQTAWILAGGHSALRFFEAAGWQRFDVLGEALPGLALGQVETATGKVWVATKPGGFGADDLLTHFLAQVQAR